MDATTDFDLVIRNGLIHDGLGGAALAADVGIADNLIVSVGRNLPAGREEIDASSCIVTPGFVDPHTHYDGQAIWSPFLDLSSLHGVTTVVIGNCGVGFAPCHKEDQDLLVNTMEGVEDIPEVVMTEGLTWDWETFPEFLDALDARPRDIDVAAFLPHSALRVYVMGERGAKGEPATAEDRDNMAALTREAIAAGAVGVGSARNFIDRRADGEFVPTYRADEAELVSVCKGMGGRGLLQILLEMGNATDEQMQAQMEMIGDIAQKAETAVTFTLVQVNQHPDRWRQELAWADEQARRKGVTIRPQVFPRPTGMIIGHALSVTPFSLCPSYMAIADLPLPDKMRELRRPEVRERIIHETPTDPTLPLVRLGRSFDKTFPLSDPPNYEPAAETSISAIAAAKGVSPEALAYDLLLEEDGHAMLFVALANYANGSLDFLSEMMFHPQAVLGLGDGGAHCGMICDASFTTFLLTHWVRDRPQGKIDLARAVQMLTSTPAQLVGLNDRGVLAPGYKADLNVIDMTSLRLNRPEVRYDLPAGGRRLHQTANGYRAIIVGGKVIVRDDKRTNELPGRLVRGQQKSRALQSDEVA